MDHKGFDCFGVERIKKGEMVDRRYFDTIAEAFVYASSLIGKYKAKVCTADKYGNVIEYI